MVDDFNHYSSFHNLSLQGGMTVIPLFPKQTIRIYSIKFTMLLVDIS